MTGGIGDAFLGKVPPHSEKAELAVIGGILLNNRSIDLVTEHIGPSDFYSDAHETIFRTIQDLDSRSRPIDLISLGEALKDKGELESVGGLSYLGSIMEHVPTDAHIEAYARIIQEKSSVRACISAALDILQKGYGDYGEAETFLDEAEQAVFEATRERSRGRLFHIDQAMLDKMAEIEVLQKHEGEITGVPTGFVDLDRVTTGLQGGDLVIVAGRPAMGKTSFALKVATNVVKRTGRGVVLFSLEMNIRQLMGRILSAEGQVDARKIRIPRQLTEGDFKSLVRVGEELHGKDLYLDDSAAMNVLEMRSKARYLRSKCDICLVVVDYLQIMQAIRSSRGDTSREREIADTTRALKALAKELDVPVMCLSQLNRSPELRANKRPVMSDLRESGAIEQDADLILFLYRDAVYSGNERDNTTEIIIGKNRNGPVGTIKLAFIAHRTSFENLDEQGAYTSEDYGDMLSSGSSHPPVPEPPLDRDDGAPF